MVVRAARSPRGGPGVALGRLYSPGSMAGALWATTGLTAPLAKFAVPDDSALDTWIQAAHGGWGTAEVTGTLVPILDADVRSAYPAAWALAGWWDVVRAASVAETDVLAEVRAFCHRAAAGDLGPLLDRASYPTLGRTLCLVRPVGEPWPTERHHRNGPRFVVGPVEAECLYVIAADALVAAYRGHAVPEIVWAGRLDPVGEEAGRPLRLRGEVVVAPGVDPIPALVRLRPQKGRDERLRAVIKGVANAAAWGVFARMDQVRLDGRLVERPGPWCWPPIAAGVPAVARLWLAAVERSMADQGGAVVARDTDGIVVTSLPEDAMVACGREQRARALPWAEVEGLLARFDGLDPFGDGRAFWDIDHGEVDRPLHILGITQKRYVKAKALGTGWEGVGGTEHALGGGIVDPPAMAGREPDRRHRWTRPVAAHALALATSGSEPFRAPWDQGMGDPFPALARWSAGSPDALAAVPEALGAHAFSPLVDAWVDRLVAPGVPAPVALDPGDDLAGWDEAHWVDHDGRRVEVSTGDDPGTAVPLARLADVAADWCVPVPAQAPGLLHVDPRLVRRVGRGGSLVDAQLADPGADPGDHQVLYDEGDAAGFVAEAARHLGPRPFARLTGLALKVAERAALGQPISAANVERAIEALGSPSPERRCALPGCERPVPRPNARYCITAHADRAYRLRKTRRAIPSGASVCQNCGAVRFGNVAGPCPACGDRAPVVVKTLICPGCGVERVGDLAAPCRFCERKARP
jgi:hypothetical protein